MRRHGALSASVGHMQVRSCTLVLQFEWNFQLKHLFQSIPSCLVEPRQSTPRLQFDFSLHLHSLHSSLISFGGMGFCVGLLLLFCLCFCFVVEVVFVANIQNIKLTTRQTQF